MYKYSIYHFDLLNIELHKNTKQDFQPRLQQKQKLTIKGNI